MAGIEPATTLLQAILSVIAYKSISQGGALHGAQKLEELEEIVRAWASLSGEFRFFIMTLVRAQKF
jgi:hypothetical protein